MAFLPITPAAIEDPDTYGKHPVGNGPYILKAWNHGQSIKLAPNRTYTGPRTVRNGGVTFMLYTDVQTAYADVESGNLDVIGTIPATSLAGYQHEEGIQAFNKPAPGFKSFTIPERLAHFSGEEGRLRRAAISHAIDRGSIVEKVPYGTAMVATDFTAPTIDGYSRDLEGASVLDHDVARAKQLWARMGAPLGGYVLLGAQCVRRRQVMCRGDHEFDYELTK